MKARTPGMRTKRLATWTLTIGLCLTMAGCVKAKGDRPVQPPGASAYGVRPGGHHAHANRGTQRRRSVER